MRLSEKEAELIKRTVDEYLNGAQIYLFGSRAFEKKKGGDIDLYIVADKNDYGTKIKLQTRLNHLLGKPVDIVMHRNFNRPIEQQALKGVKL